MITIPPRNTQLLSIRTKPEIFARLQRVKNHKVIHSLAATEFQPDATAHSVSALLILATPVNNNI